MASNRVYKEEEISEQLGDAYDQEKDEGDPVEAPYRTLTNWYLTKANKPDERVALPDDCRFKGNVVLHAMLEGKSHDTPAVSIQISLSKEHAWVVDRTPEKRGIWIEYGQGGAWYWLKEWDESQDDLQQPIRAKLGLFNNIFNILFDVHDGVEGHYALGHITLTPKQLHQRLSCNDDEAFENFKKSSERRFLVFQEPFDYSLLAEHGGAKFCRDHSRGLFDGYEKSKFFKDLSKGKSNKKWSIKEYRRSAELAEQRSQCEPWGEPRVRAKPIRPNWNMEAKLGQTTAPEAKKKGSKKRAGSTGDEEEPANKKRRVLEDSEDEEMEAPPPKKSRRFQPEDEAMEEVDLMKEESYSNQRMVAALTKLEEYLEPKPVNETGSWEDVVEKKFRIKDVSSAGDVVSMMRDSNELTQECRLLMVTAFLNVCLLPDKGANETKIIKKMFNSIKGGDERVNGANIFDRWKREAKVMLDRLAALDTQDPKWFTHIVAYHLLVQYIKFIKDCGFVISKKKMLKVLNEKFDLKWNQPDYLDDIVGFANKYEFAPKNVEAGGPQDLRRACFLTKQHLKKIIDGPVVPKPKPVTSETTSTTGPDTSSAPSVTPSTDASSKERVVENAAKASSQKITAVASEGKDDTKEDEAAERKRKRDEERRKKMRMQLMNNTASVIAAQSVAQPAAQPVSPARTKTSQPGATENTSRPSPIEATATNWLTKPAKIVARPEDWKPVTGKEPFFLNRKITPSPDDEAKPAARLQDTSNRGRSQQARSETSRNSDRRDTVRELGQVPPEKSRENRRGHPRSTVGYPQSSYHSGGPDGNSIRGGRDHRPPVPSRRYDHVDDQARRDTGRLRDVDRRSSSFERGGSRSRDYDRNQNDRPENWSETSRQERPTAPRRDRSTDHNESGFQRGDRRHSPSRDDDRRLDNQQRRPPAFGSLNEAKEAMRGSHASQPIREAAIQQHQAIVQQVVQQAAAEDAPSVGRGRGLSRTRPAWMTEGLSNGASLGGGSVTSSVSSAAVPSQPPQQGAPVFGGTQQQALASTNGGLQPSGLLANDDVPSRGHGRGRGLNRTRPAWMSQGLAGGPSSGEGTDVGPANVNTSLGVSGPQSVAAFSGTGASQALPNTSQISGQQYQANGFPLNEDMSTRGGGRGLNRTRPAWMTQQGLASSNGPLGGANGPSSGGGTFVTSVNWGPATVNPSLGVPDSAAPPAAGSFAALAGRNGHPQPPSLREGGAEGGKGRGRGRELTLPAWMTRGKK